MSTPMRDKIVDAVFDAVPGKLHLEDAQKIVDAALEVLLDPTDQVRRWCRIGMSDDLSFIAGILAIKMGK